MVWIVWCKITMDTVYGVEQKLELDVKTETSRDLVYDL